MEGYTFNKENKLFENMFKEKIKEGPEMLAQAVTYLIISAYEQGLAGVTELDLSKLEQMSYKCRTDEKQQNKT